MQLVFHSPKDVLASAVAVAAALAIIINALFLQAGRHPSPLFAAILPPPELPETQPVSGSVTVSTPVATQPAQAPAAAPQAIQSPLPRPRPPEAEARPGDQLGHLVRATSFSGATGSTAVPRPPASIPQAPAPAKADTGSSVTSARVAAVQRALTDYGYGQIKATGTVGADTQAAIQRFERERKLPLTGQVSERLVRELGLATGRNFD